MIKDEPWPWTRPETVMPTGTLNDKTFIAKLDPSADDGMGSNAPTWVAQVGGGGNGIAVDHAGAVLVVGNFSGTADFNPSPTVTYNLTGGGAYALKLTSGGTFAWAVNFKPGSYGDSRAHSVAADSGNNVYVEEAFKGTVDFDPSNKKLNLPMPAGTTCT